MKMKKLTIILMLCILGSAISGCMRKNSFQIITPAINGEGDKYYLMGDEAYWKEDYSGAIDFYLKALDYYTAESSAESEIALTYFTLGQCHTRLTQYQTAIDYFEKSLAICEKLSGEEELVRDNYMYLASTKRAIGNDDLKEALEYGQKAEKLTKKLYGKKSVQTADIYVTLAYIYIEMGEPESAYDYLQKSLKIYGEGNENTASIYISLSRVYEQQGEYAKEEEALKKAISLYRFSGDLEDIANAYYCLGDFYSFRKNESDAIDCYNKCLDVYTKKGIKDFRLSQYIFSRGCRYYNIEDYENYKNDFTLAFLICRDLPQSDLTELLTEIITGHLKNYYNSKYEGDKSQGFDKWFEECLENQSIL